jgi:hypothetical protein
MFVLIKNRDPRVERLNNIEEETQGMLDRTLKYGENEEEADFTLINVERMVTL